MSRKCPLFRGIATAFTFFVAILSAQSYGQPFQLEYLDRGLVAVKASESEVYLSWRLLVSDDDSIGFNVYRSADGQSDVKLNTAPLRATTDFIDPAVDFSVSNSYYVRPLVNGIELGASKTATVEPDAPVQQYLSLPLQKPEGGVTPDGVNYSYTANDLSVGDLDGDGRYEVVVKWYPTNAKDNAQSGYTGNTILDAYTLEGDLLWRIDLGINIRSGAHYTQFMVYDLDGDGIAEVATRTAEGSMDASGAFIAQEDKWSGERPEIDHTADHRTSGGYILQGPEFLTIYDGRTGYELASTLYVPQRYPGTYYPTGAQIDEIWGDNYGNRIDRFLAAVAYLDGERPSLVMCRGYYTRAALAAWDWRDGKLTQRWVFDTYGNPEYSAYRGEGAHSLTVGDVDGDGADEIVYGAATIDHDGTGLYATGIGHGDALHLSDMNPDLPGLEVWMPHECPSCYGEYGSEMHNAATGEIIFGVSGEGSDVGRGAAADIDPNYRGFETWASRGGMHTAYGESLETNGLPAMNFLVWWDGDPLRELLDNIYISKWNPLLTRTEVIFTDEGIVSNNGTKATPGLSGDILGDWREEVIWASNDSSELRIYTTIIPARSRMVTLMHDRQYRLAIAWQNVAYNQPPHTSFYLGDGMETPPKPDFYYNNSNQAPSVALVSPGDGSYFEEGDVADLVADASDEDGTVESIEFFENRKFLGTDFTDPYTALWDATNGGSYQLRAVATDEKGAQAVSLPVTVTVGHTDSYDAGDGVSGWTSMESTVEGYRGDGYLVFERPWHFVEFMNLDGGLVGGEKTLRIRYSMGRPGVSPVFLVVNGVRQMIQLPSTGTDENWQEFEVKVNLESGPVNSVRLQARGVRALIDEVSVAGIVRNQAPMVEIINPQDGMEFPEGADISIVADALDIGGSITSVDFYAGETLLGSDDTAPFSFDWTNIGEGLYSLTADATDDLGAKTVSDPIGILVNNPPSVEIVSPSSGSYVPSGEIVSIVAEADDGVGTVEEVAFFIGDTFLASDTEAPFSVDWSSEEQGAYTFSAVATDNRGFSTQSTPIDLTVNPSGYGVTYQAEEAIVEGEAWLESTNNGFKGTGYVNFGTDGGSLRFERVDGGSGSMAILRVRYALGAAGSRIGTMTVNGVTQEIEFMSTGAWTTYESIDFPFPFDAGKSNTVEFASTGADLANVDEIAVIGLQSETDLTYHAENAYQENLALETNNLGFNGTGFVNFPGEGGLLEFRELDGGIGGTITLKIRYALGASGERTGTLSINGVEEPISFPSSGGWSTYTTIERNISLLAGPQNTLSIASIGNDLGNVDEILLSGVTPNEIPEVTLLTPTDEVGDADSIFLVGDSTVMTYGSSDYPMRGWGQELQHFLYDGAYVVQNRAIGGRSSRSYIEEGRWDNVKTELEEGDFVLIQFGHNDRDSGNAGRYTPPADYEEYLAQYVEEARALGAEPILVTPMVMNAWRGSTMRNVFTEDGNDYAGSMKNVAAALDVPLIDLNQKSFDFFSALDPDTNSRYYYNAYVAGEYPNYPDGVWEGTHFQQMGALQMAKFIAEGFSELSSNDLVGEISEALMPQYPVSIKANIADAGRVTMSTELPAGVNFTLKALSEDGHTFINWKDDEGETISSSSLYEFELGPNGERIVAYFDNETPVGPPAPGVVIPGGSRADLGWQIGDLMEFTAEASDPDGTIEKVEYFAREARVKLGEATEPPYALEWIVEGGTYEVWAEAVDNYGARGRSEGYLVDIQFDNSAPVVSIISPEDGATGNKGEEVLIEAEAYDEDGTIARVEIYIDGSLYAEDTEAPYSTLWIPEEEGPHAIEVLAYDNFGTSSSMESVAYGVFYETGGELAQEAEDGILVGSFTVIDDEEASSGQAVEAVSGPASENYVEFRFNVPQPGYYALRTLIKALDGRSDSMYVSVDGANPEQHTWFVARSNTFIQDYVLSGDQDPLELNLDAGAHFVRFGYREPVFLDFVELEFLRERPENYFPEVAISAPAADSVYEEGDSIEITTTTSDVDGEVVLVEFFANGSKVGESADSPFSFTWDTATGGSYSLTAVAWDDYGDSSTSEPVEVSVLFPGGQPLQEAESATAAGFVFPREDPGASGGEFMRFFDPESAGIISGEVYQFINLGSGHALEANGREVFQGAIDGSDAQKWTIIEDGEGVYGVVSVETGEGLDEYQGGSTNVGLWTYESGKSNQQWSFTEDEGAYIVSSLISTDVMSIEGALDDDGSNVYRTADSGSDHQRWMIVPAGGGGSGPEANYLEFNFNVEEDETFNLLVTYRALDEESNSVYVSVDGGPADQYLWEMPVTSGFESALVTPVGETEALELDFSAGAHTVRLGFSEPVDIDQVELVLDPDIGNGRTYQFINVGTGMALSSESRAVFEGVNEYLDSQQWVVDEVSEGVFSIILKGSSEGLDHYQNDGYIGTWTFDASKANQLWDIVEVEEGIYTLSPLSTDASVVISPGVLGDPPVERIVLGDYVAAPEQQWMIVNPEEAEPKAETVYLLGDSTVADYADGYYPQTGWGQVLKYFFDPEVDVKNRAIGGTSSRSYYNSFWPDVRDELEEGDFVFIGFGINDRANDDDRNTTGEEFKEFLTLYVNETLAAGAHPVLVSTVRRNAWNGTDPDTLYDAYHEHPEVSRQLAGELGLPLIDLDQDSVPLYEDLGPAYVGPFIYLNLREGEYPLGSRADNVHFQEAGALEMARLVVESIQTQASDENLSRLIEWIYDSYEVAVSSNDPDAGLVTRTQSYPAGTPVTVKALPNDGYDFVRWENSLGEEVGTHSVYQFDMGEADQSFEAIFAEAAPPEPEQPDPITGIISGATYTVQNVGSSLLLQNPEGRAVSQGSATGDATQQFVFTKLDDGFYTINALGNAENLDAYGSGELGTYISNASNANQNWQVTLNDGEYVFESRSQSGNVVSVEGDSLDDGANVNWAPLADNDFQRWTLTLVE